MENYYYLVIRAMIPHGIVRDHKKTNTLKVVAVVFDLKYQFNFQFPECKCLVLGDKRYSKLR